MPTSRLAEARSPYLRQHAEDPVDWYPWGDEAFERAAALNRPVFLSIGYSSCHWCHVMHHESFQDSEVADLLNGGFVSVKVDREEHPDVDDAYMAAVQLASGHGGWPMSLFLTPDRKPFFAATYIPREDRDRSAGFKSLLRAVRDAWTQSEADLRAAAEELSSAVRDYQEQRPAFSGKPVGVWLAGRARDALLGSLDREYGGFGKGAPKFPAPEALLLLIEFALRGDEAAREGVFITLDGMARGAMHDLVGGGFHRYSTDRRWFLPHFEKMLYDNGQLLAAYARADRWADDGRFAWVAARMVRWMEDELLLTNGMYASALDADSPSGEGWFYSWRHETLERLFGEKCVEFCAAFGCTREGNFFEEASREATGRNLLRGDLQHAIRWAAELDLLRASRDTDEAPFRDEKALTSWNGLALRGLCAAGRLDEAQRLAKIVLDRPVSHLYLGDQAGGDPYLDSAQFVLGLLELCDVVQDGALRQVAAERFDALAEGFRERVGGWNFSSDLHSPLFGKSKPAIDSSEGNAAAAAIECEIKLGKLSEAREDLEYYAGWIEAGPSMTCGLSRLILVYGEELFGGAAVRTAAGPPRAELTVEPKDVKVQGGQVEGVLKLSLPEGWKVQESLAEIDLRVDGLSVIAVESVSGANSLPTWKVLCKPPEGDEGEAEITMRLTLCSESECLPTADISCKRVWYRR